MKHPFRTLALPLRLPLLLLGVVGALFAGEPAALPYRIEKVQTRDVTELFAANTSNAPITIHFEVRDLAGGQTEGWPLAGDKSCPPGERVRLTAIVPIGTAAPTFQIQSTWKPVLLPIAKPSPARPEGDDSLDGVATPGGARKKTDPAGLKFGLIPIPTTENPQKAIEDARPARMRAAFAMAGMKTSKLKRIDSFEPGANSPVLELPFGPGVTSVVTQGYNGAESHGGETAIDFSMPVGTPVCAAFAGTVVATRTDGKITSKAPGSLKASNSITICSADGLVARYGHLDIDGVLVKPGQSVTAGQEIGRSGKTGGVNIRPHLHFVTERWELTAVEMITVPVPVWFRTSEGQVAVIGGKKYSRP